MWAYGPGSIVLIEGALNAAEQANIIENILVSKLYGLKEGHDGNLFKDNSIIYTFIRPRNQFRI